MMEHKAVMEAKLGRKLVKGESVHHKNAIRHDNRPENLELWVGGRALVPRRPENARKGHSVNRLANGSKTPPLTCSDVIGAILTIAGV